MSTLMEELEKDPFIGTPIPGQSLTATPGSLPYEKPPMPSDPEHAYDALKQGLYQRANQRQIGHLTRAGISCETLASSMVMIAFTKGMFNPDVAEIIKPFIAVEIFKIAKDQGVDKVILENKPINKGIDTNALEELKQEAMPDNKFDVELPPELQSFMEEEGDMDMQQEIGAPQEEGFMSRPEKVEQDVV